MSSRYSSGMSLAGFTYFLEHHCVVTTSISKKLLTGELSNGMYGCGNVEMSSYSGLILGQHSGCYSRENDFNGGVQGKLKGNKRTKISACSSTYI